MNKNKLKHNFLALSKFDKLFYIIFIYPFQSKKDRLFFMGSLFLQGQLYKAERMGLYDIIRAKKPDYCFEIGTYTGGGSTFFISRALRDNKNGKLFTTETDDFLFNKAIRRYNKYIKSQRPFIEFIKSSSPSVFNKYLQEKDKTFMMFLDGAENGEQTLEQYNFFKPYFKPGTILALHDWKTEKTILVKPVILTDNNWKKVVELDKPDSLGFVIFIRQ